MLVLMDETNAFFAALLSRKPDEPTACDGWRVRDLVAHIVAGAKEESELIENSLGGGAPRPTRPFAEREAAYRAMPYPDLLNELADQGARLSTAIEALIGTGGVVEFTGALVTGDELRTHGRSELVLHRWDLVGDDEIGRGLLAQPELTVHAVRVLTQMSSLQESVAARAARLTDVPADFAFRLRSPGCDDVVVGVAPTPSLKLASPADGVPVVRLSAGDRLLVLWGRRPVDDAVDLSGISAPQTRRLIETMLYL